MHVIGWLRVNSTRAKQTEGRVVRVSVLTGSEESDEQ